MADYAKPTISSTIKQKSRCTGIINSSSEKTITSSPNKDRTVSAKLNHTKKPQKQKSVAKTGEEKEKGAPKITGSARKKRTDRETKDVKIAKEEVTHEQEECQEKCRELQNQLNDADEKNKTLSKELEEVKKSQEVLFDKLKQSKIRCEGLEIQLVQVIEESSAKSRSIEVYQARIEQLQKELEQNQTSLHVAEEKKFKLTNEFTSAGEGSVLDISNRYRYLQHNKRPAAVREMKKVCNIDFREHMCGQVMCAYETAKAMALNEASSLIEKVLFELQPVPQDPAVVHDKELQQTCMILLGYIQNDTAVNATATMEIHKKLMDHSTSLVERGSLPPEVVDYYQSLAELTWCAVTRPIPMVIAKSPDTYHKIYHELKYDDDEEIEDNIAIDYVYPVLYSSNKSPRELAQKGKVVLRKI